MKLALCYISSLVVYDIFFSCKKLVIVIFFVWADKEMSPYE
jgi:hypothetical protein